MLINNTNREHTTWSREQLEAASEYGDVVDMIMPGLSAEADEGEADRVAGLVVRRILRRLGRETGAEGRTGDVKSPDSTDDPTEAGVAQADPREAGVEQADSTEAGVEQADSTEAGVTQAAPTDGNEEAVAAVRDRAKDAVLCQGDFTLVYRVVARLKDAGVTVMAPTFQRVTKPTLRPDGTTVPGYSFDFVRFRMY